MVIDDLDQFGDAVTPDEADAPPIIDPNAVLPATVALERLQAISRRRAKIRKAGCRIKHVKLAQRYRFDRSELGRCLALVQRLGAPVLERPDHRVKI